MIPHRPKLRDAGKRFVYIGIDFRKMPFALCYGCGVASCGIVSEKAHKVDARQCVSQHFSRHTCVKIASYNICAGVELMRIGHRNKSDALSGLHGSDLLCDFKRSGFDIIWDVAMHDIICCRDSCYFFGHLGKGH